MTCLDERRECVCIVMRLKCYIELLISLCLKERPHLNIVREQKHVYFTFSHCKIVFCSMKFKKDSLISLIMKYLPFKLRFIILYFSIQYYCIYLWRHCNPFNIDQMFGMDMIINGLKEKSSGQIAFLKFGLKFIR